LMKTTVTASALFVSKPPPSPRPGIGSTTDCIIAALISLAAAAAFSSCATSKTPAVVIFPQVQVVNFVIGLSATRTFTGPGFASSAAASDALRNLQVSPPATGATVAVAAGLEGVAVAVVAVGVVDVLVDVLVAVAVEPEQPTDKMATLTMSRLRGRY